MVKKNLLSITQLAKLRKLTSETLRHYDRIGLIKPDYVDPKTKYRYYSIRQYEKLGTIKELRQLGISIDCITDYFKNRNLKKSTSILEIHQQILKQEIKEKKRLTKILGNKIQFLNELSSLPIKNVVSQEEFPDRYVITFDEPSGGSHEHAFAFAKLEWYLQETAPILASDRVGVYSDDSILQESDNYIPASPFIFVKKKCIPTELRKIIPKGTYLCMCYQDGELEKYHESFEIIKDYMKTHNMVSNGPILQFYKIDVTITSDPNETLMQIQIPIAKV